jgi:hypothetical protein
VTASEIDLTPSEIEVTASKIESTAPEIEVTPPEIKVTASEIEVTPPEIDLTASEIELTPSEIEVTASEMKVTVPRIDLTLSVAQRTPPEIERTVSDASLAPLRTARPTYLAPQRKVAYPRRRVPPKPARAASIIHLSHCSICHELNPFPLETTDQTSPFGGPLVDITSPLLLQANRSGRRRSPCNFMLAGARTGR